MLPRADRAATIAGLATMAARASGVDAEEIDESTRLREDLGLDSLALIELAVHIEEEWGVPAEQFSLPKLVTLSDVADVITAYRGGRADAGAP